MNSFISEEKGSDIGCCRIHEAYTVSQISDLSNMMVKGERYGSFKKNIKISQ